MATFTGVEVWSDVACNGGVRVGRLPLGTLLTCTATWTTDARDSLTLAVPFAAPDAGTLSRGRVVRVCTDDPAVWDEWRVLDLSDDAQTRVRTAKCDGILQDLARAVYTAYDGTGQPQHEFSAVGVDVEGIIDGPVTDALADAGIAYLAKGTVTPTGTFDVDGEYYSARSLLGDAVGAVGAEVRARRNGTTNYLLDVDTELGSTAPMAYARTARNLLATQRQRQGSLGGTRVIPRGADDSTSRGIGYAYWEVTNVAGNVLTLRDPRGAGFPSPLPFQDMAVGWWARKRASLLVFSQITASVDAGSGTADVTVVDGSAFTVGDFVELTLDMTLDGISFVAANSIASSGVTTTGDIRTGDVALVWAYINNSNTAPTAITGGGLTWTSILDGGANSNSARVAWATVIGDTGSFSASSTTATHIACVVFRGVRGVGASAQDTGNSNTISYPGLTLEAGGSSWVAAFAGHRAATNANTPPTDTTLRTSTGGGTVAAFSTSAGLSSWTTRTVGVNATNGWRSATVELLAARSPRRLWALDYPAAQAAQAGVYDRILDRPSLSGVVNYASDPFVRDFTGEVRFPFVVGNGGQISASTANATVTGSGTSFTSTVQVGDKVYNTAGPTLLGTVLTVSSNTQLTLTANSLANATNVNWTLGKAAPLGATVVAGTNGAALSTQVDANVLGVAAKAWRLRNRSASGTTKYRFQPITASGSVGIPVMYWVWCEVVALSGSNTLAFRLVDSASGSAVSQDVVLTSAEVGKQVRVMIQDNWPLSVRLELDGAGAGTDAWEVLLGPYGAQPAWWAITDVENPRACDLWHEGTLWLQTQSIPERYDLDLADLATIDGARFPFEDLALGGYLTIDDRDLGIRSVQRIVSLTRDYIRPGEVSLVLGRRQKGLAEYLASASTASINDIALQLSRGLVAQGEAVAASPIITATPGGQTTDDGAATVSIGLNIRQAFRL